MDGWQLVIFGIATFTMSILSGAAGGGGGVILTPLAIFLGLTPQQAISTGKLNGLAVALGSLQQFRKAKLHSWKIVIPLMIMAATIGLVAPIFITNINNDSYSKILGVLLLALIPVMLIKKVGKTHHKVSLGRRRFGYVLLAPIMLLQAIFSTGLGMLVNIVFMSFLGMDALEANVTKRYIHVILNTCIFIGVLGSGLIIWHVAFVTTGTSFAGSWVGARIALKKGNDFVTWLFIILMFVSGVGLLVI